jgi:hypothetical protein
LRRPGKRAFGRANSGLVFQTAADFDRNSSPLLLLFYADKSFSGKHRTHHPIYSKCILFQVLYLHRKQNLKSVGIVTVSVLNLHEDERQKPENWIPIGWMPIYDDKQSTRPTQGYEADPARKARLFHDCFRLLLRSWDEETKSPQNIVWGDQKRRQTRFFLGGLMGDQQVMYKIRLNMSKYV